MEYTNSQYTLGYPMEHFECEAVCITKASLAYLNFTSEAIFEQLS